MSLKFLAMIQGGIGEDVWEKEWQFTAADFVDAAGLAQARANELGGHVSMLEQSDMPPMDFERWWWNVGSGSQPVLIELHGDMKSRICGELVCGEDGLWYFNGFPIFVISTHFAVIECHENQTEILYA